MEFRGRALYNLLRISAKDRSSCELMEPWQILDYRSLTEEELVKNLSHLGLPISKKEFLLYAENADSPEDLAEFLWVQESDFIGQEKAYLILFELWRRLLSHRKSLSIFCDELDDLIRRFDEGSMLDEEEAETLLSELQDILEQGVEEGQKPKELFSSISQYMAHDVEGFLYDYIVELLQEESDLLAAALIQAFEGYVQEKKWFMLLRARLFSISGMQEWSTLVHRMIEEERDFSFLIEVAYFLAEKDDIPLLKKCLAISISYASSSEDLQEVVSIVSGFMDYFEEGVLHNQMQKVEKSSSTEEIKENIATLLSHLKDQVTSAQF
jgi:hypothetical protein